MNNHFYGITKKYLEYYQFHETDENGNVICLYCIVKITDDGICLQFEKEYNTALEELKEFAYNNEIYTTEELKNSSKLHLQVPNKKFREELAKKYGYKTDEINNFNEKFGISLIVPLDDTKINYEEVINPTPVSEDTNSNPTPVSEDANSNPNPNSNDGDENTDEDEMGDFDTEKRHPIIEKLKSLKLKGIKKLAIRIGAIATIAVLGITGIKACSKKGVSEDLVTVQSVTDNDDPIEYIDQDPTAEENNISDSNSVTNLPTFQTYLNQSCKTTKNYMNNFKKNLQSFNKLAKNYADTNKNSRLGLDTDNYTAFKMAMLGSEFGNFADNVSTHWNSDELYKDYLKTTDQLKQLATVQVKSTGFAKTLKGKERQEFYQKYEDMIIDLNSTENNNEKIAKAENIFSQIKSDFNMDSEDYNPGTLLRSDSKYVAVVPLVRNLYDRAKDCGYDNIPSADKMERLSKSYRNTVKENINKALSSIEVKESITPSYEMYARQIALDLEQDDLYVIDDERNIRDTGIYKIKKTLPKKVKEVTPTPTVTEAPVATAKPEAVAPTTTDENVYSNNNINTDNTDTSEATVPTYTTTDDNFEYTQETPVENPSWETENNNQNDNNTSSDSSIADQIIESDEGTNEDTNDNNSDNSDSNVDDSQITESEEDIANSMNDAINNGGYAEVPDDWQIDDDYKIDGTDIIDGSVSDITIEGSSDSVDTTTEEVPTVEDNTSSQDYGIIESEEDYEAPSTDVVEETTPDVESVVTEEEPVYEGTVSSTDSINDTNITEDNSTIQEDTDVTTYQVDETVTDEVAPVEQTVAKLTQDQAIDQVINYNTRGMNAIPVFNAKDNSWRVEVIDNATNEVKTTQYNI